MEDTTRENAKRRLSQPVHFEQQQSLVFVGDLSILIDVFAGADEDAVNVAVGLLAR